MGRHEFASPALAGEMEIRVKSAPPPGDDPNEFILSDSGVDRMGDVVEAKGWQFDQFKTIALFNHDRDQPIGEWKNVRVVGGELRGNLQLAKAGTSARIDEIRSLVEQKILRAVSVGFTPLQKELLTKEADKYRGPFRFTKSELLECSLVTVPANPRALAVARSLGISNDTLSMVFRVSAENSTDARGVSAKPLVPEGAKKMTILTLSQKIQAAQKRIVGLRDQLTELGDREDLNDDEQKYLNEIPDMIEAENNELVALEKREKALALRVGTPPQQQPVAQDLTPAASPAFSLPKKKVEPTDYAFRAVAVAMRSFASQTPPDQALRTMYGNDEGTQIVLRAAVNPAMTTTAGYAAELVQTAYAGFMDRLIANSLYAPLAEAGMRIDFGSNGVIKIPTRTTTKLAGGAWVAEGAAKPVKKISLAPISLTPTKMAVITTFTEEMAYYSTPAIEGILRKAMADDTSESLDGYLIDAVAASAGVRPAGLLNGVTPVSASSATTTVQKVIDDLNALIKPMEAVGGGGKVVLFVNPAQYRSLGMVTTTTGDFVFDGAAAAATKFGINRIVASRTVPVGQVIAVDAEWFVTATGDTPRFAISTEATLHEEDTAPSALSATGTPNTVAAPMRSLFQTDSMAIRLSLYVTWAMTRSAMVQTITSVGW